MSSESPKSSRLPVPEPNSIPEASNAASSTTTPSKPVLGSSATAAVDPAPGTLPAPATTKLSGTSSSPLETKKSAGTRSASTGVSGASGSAAKTGSTNPAAAMVARCEAWKGVVLNFSNYFQAVRQTASQKRDLDAQLKETITNVEPSTHFLPSGSNSIVDVPPLLQKLHGREATVYDKLIRAVETDYTPRLRKLDSGLDKSIADFRGLSKSFEAPPAESTKSGADAIEKDKIKYAKAIEALQSGKTGGAAAPTASSPALVDPYVLKQSLDQKINAQLGRLNSVADARAYAKDAIQNVDKAISTELQAILQSYAETLGRAGEYATAASTGLLESYVVQPPTAEVTAWLNSGRAPSDFTDEAGLQRKSRSDLSYPYENSSLARAVRKGTLERRTKYLRSFVANDYVLTLSTLIELKQGIPDLGIDLSGAKLVTADNKHAEDPEKFVLYAKQIGTTSGKFHTWVFRAKDAGAWKDALVAIISAKTPTAAAEKLFTATPDASKTTMSPASGLSGNEPSSKAATSAAAAAPALSTPLSPAEEQLLKRAEANPVDLPDSPVPATSSAPAFVPVAIPPVSSTAPTSGALSSDAGAPPSISHSSGFDGGSADASTRSLSSKTNAPISPTGGLATVPDVPTGSGIGAGAHDEFVDAETEHYAPKTDTDNLLPVSAKSIVHPVDEAASSGSDVSEVPDEATFRPHVEQPSTETAEALAPTAAPGSLAWQAQKDQAVFSGLSADPDASAANEDAASVWSYDLKHDPDTFKTDRNFEPVDADLAPHIERRLTNTEHKLERPELTGIGAARTESETSEPRDRLLARRRSSVSVRSRSLSRERPTRRATGSYGDIQSLKPLTAAEVESAEPSALFFDGELPKTTSGAMAT